MKEPPFSEGVKEGASEGGTSRKLVGVGKLETNCLRGGRLTEVA
jgi:hypothetical protein